MRVLQTSSLTNQNIVSDLLLATYTADANRAITIDIFLDQVAGNGDYTAYLTHQRLGSGSFHKSAVTTLSAASGVTAIWFPSIEICVENTSVIKVYAKGLAGDTTTPDSVVTIKEKDYVRPTVAGRTLDISATGEAGLDFDNIKDATGAHNLTNITVPVVTTLTNTPGDSSGITTLLGRIIGTLSSGTHRPQSGDSYSRLGNPIGASISADIAGVPNSVDVTLSASHGAGLWTRGTGDGPIAFTYSVTDDSTLLPIADANVAAYTDVNLLNKVAQGYTNNFGNVVFYLDAGTYYFVTVKAGYSFRNPDVETVS